MRVIGIALSVITVLLTLAHFALFAYLEVASGVHETWHQRFAHVIERDAPGYQTTILFLFKLTKVSTFTTGVWLMLVFGVQLRARSCSWTQ